MLPTCTKCFNASKASSTLAKNNRINGIGIQMLSKQLHDQMFFDASKRHWTALNNNKRMQISAKHPKKQNMWKKEVESTLPISFKLPEIYGLELGRHFEIVGKYTAHPFLSFAKDLLKLSELPPIPEKWKFQSGWTRYCKDLAPEKVPYPDGNAIFFDIETSKYSKFPVLACAVSGNN